MELSSICIMLLMECDVVKVVCSGLELMVGVSDFCIMVVIVCWGVV